MENAVLDSSSTLTMELAGLIPGQQYDKIIASGVLELRNGRLAVTPIDGFSPHAGDAFDLLDWGTLTGTFASLSLPGSGCWASPPAAASISPN